jgi:hypothetical protein
MRLLRQKNSFKDNQFTEKLGFSPIGTNGWQLGLIDSKNRLKIYKNY